MTRVYNRQEQKEKRRQLRRDMPRAEQVLWLRLKHKQLCGFKFRRQYSVGPFVLDLYCPEVKLALEIDGDSHFVDSAKTRDAHRQAVIESYGIRVLRFTNSEVYENMDGVIQAIVQELQWRGSTPA